MLIGRIAPFVVVGTTLKGSPGWEGQSHQTLFVGVKRLLAPHRLHRRKQKDDLVEQFGWMVLPTGEHSAKTYRWRQMNLERMVRLER